MQFEVLARAIRAEGKCLLIEASLADYLDSLGQDFQGFEIQREAVKNVYLDRISDTLVQKAHIPLIVLLIDEDTIGNSKFGELDSPRVLDGLQRTIRLKALLECARVAERHGQLPDEEGSEAIKQIVASGTVGKDIVKQAIRQIEQYTASDKTNTPFTALFERRQWFELWIGLSLEQQVKKMLLLNAGHRPVSARHQLELLFLNWLPEVQRSTHRPLRIVREKEKSSIRFAKERQASEFHFSHLIAGMIALERGKAIVTNAELIQDIQRQELSEEFISGVSTSGFLHGLLAILTELENSLSKDGQEGVRWLGREVVIVGILGAIGRYAAEKKIPLDKALERARTVFSSFTGWNLAAFEEARNSVDLGKVNIGNVNKAAIFNAMSDLLNAQYETSLIVWQNYFPKKVVK